MSSIKDLKFDNKNFNKHTEFGMSLLEKSLRENGAGRSILIDKDNNIIAGNGVVESAGQIGIDKVKVVETTGDEIIAVKRTDISLNSKKGRKMALADNSTAKADLEWDEENLKSEFDEEEMKEWGVDLDWQEETEVTEDEAPEVNENEPADSELGKVYKLGNHRLMCGDSTDADSVAILMDGQKADMVFTDPPYNIASHSRNYAATGKTTKKTYKTLAGSEWDKNFNIKPALENISSFSKSDSVAYVCTSQFLIQTIWDWADQYYNFNSYIVWCKPNPTPCMSKRHWTFATELIVYATRGKYTCNFPERGNFLNFYGYKEDAVSEIDFAPEMNYWIINKEQHTENHPTQKPVKVSAKPIAFSSTKDAIVLDLFGGSGSTLIACEQLGRKCYMMELDPKYCDVIRKRYWKFVTGSEEGWQDGTKAVSA